MVTPLHIEIAMHYHCRTGQYEMVTTNETRHGHAEDLVRAGLLKRLMSCPGTGIDPGHIGYFKTDALAVWIEAICSVPFPVQQWVIPGQDPSHD